MGYTTTFKGTLKFNPDLTAKELGHLKKYLGEDIRDHLEWLEGGFEEKDLYYVQFEINDDFSGIEWDGSEKFYGSVDCVNLLTKEMRKVRPDFEFTGELQAQGEEADDRWILRMKDGIAKGVKLVSSGDKVECPHCGETFSLGELKEEAN